MNLFVSAPCAIERFFRLGKSGRVQNDQVVLSLFLNATGQKIECIRCLGRNAYFVALGVLVDQLHQIGADFYSGHGNGASLGKKACLTELAAATGLASLLKGVAMILVCCMARSSS